MSRVLLLLKYYMKMQKTKGKLQMPTWVRYLLFVVIILMLSGTYAGAVGGSYGFLKKTGAESVLLELILVSGGILTLIIGFFNVINTFFLAEDTEMFLPLPFKGSEIVFSKLISTLAYLYIYSLIIALPLITYGIVSHAGVMFYVYAFCAYIFNPIIPMIFAFIISSILMRLLNLSKHKDAVKVVFTIVLITLIVLINIVFKSNDIGKQTADIVMTKAVLIKAISLIFINVKLVSLALVSYGSIGGLLNILEVFLIVLILSVILYFVSEKMYLKSIKDSADGEGKKKTGKIIIRETSILRALIMKEFKVVFRTPVFLINCVVMLFYIPVIYIFIIFSNAFSSPYWHVGFVVIGASTISIMIGMSSGSAASTALSREGENIVVSKYIPVSYKTQALAKLISSFLINSLIILLGIGILLFERVGVEIFVLSLIIQILACFLVTIIGIYTDYSHPKITWETEKSLYKGNFKNFTNIIVGAILGGIILALAIVIKNTIIVFLLNAIILLVIIAIIGILLNKKIVKTYESL
ncbi:MAG: putative ABC transporter permease subunit [Clostridium sp.]|uniref:putative ABC transporter permease subunit n=1 Tax=Clostridium sp. TaxID=1506 RepID=UPI003F341587